MNPNKDKIGWCDWTWNPITGCLHACAYCYARKIALRFGDDFKPKIHRNRLNEWIKPRSGDRVFVGSMADMFGAWVDAGWIQEVLDTCEKRPDVNFLFLTKNPPRYQEFDLPPNCWTGATATNGKMAMESIPFLNGHIRYLSCEPLLEPILISPGIDWLIVGGMTGPKATPCPDEWIEGLINAARMLAIPIYIKDSHYKKFPIREFPTPDAMAGKEEE